MSAHLPTGTVTFLFTDIEGSTQLWERYPQTMAAALAWHDKLLREVIAAHDGRVVKHLGDGVYAVFPRAADGVAAAVAAQKKLRTTNDERQVQRDTRYDIRDTSLDATAADEPATNDQRPPTTDPLITDPLTTAPLTTDLLPTEPLIRVRMGLHTGEAELREGDYHGSALNRAERIMAAGHGGQLLLSATTANVCEGALPPGGTLRDLGEHRLRGLSRPERIFQLLLPDLPAHFPPLRSLGEYVVSLPTPATRFVGRRAEVSHIVDQLADPALRLLSLVGPGGAGKTRLAIEAAGEIGRAGHDRFRDGVTFVALASLAAAEAMPNALAQALGFRFRQSDEPPRRQLLDFLRRKQLLLVMDNFEHLLAEGAADLVAELLENAPNVGILATSRTRLNVPGETLVNVGGMRAPDVYTIRRWQAVAASEEEVETAIARAAADYSAVRLFAQSAARVRPGFRLGADNIADVARVCRQVQGSPLGIELAAAWLEALSLPEIAEEIEHNLDILATEQRGVPDRQRSIRAVFDTSWALLTDRERAILPMLSVFRGSFAREAAEFVAAANPRDLLGLVNKSWLTPTAEQKTADRRPPTEEREQAAEGHPPTAERDTNDEGSSLGKGIRGRRSAVGGRFLLHALLRQYAAEKLETLPELAEQAHDRQARYFARFLESNLRRMIGDEQVRAFDAVAEEFDDIRQAWEWWAGRGEFGRLVDSMLLPLYVYSTARFVGTAVAPLLDGAIAALPTTADGRPPTTARESAISTGLAMDTISGQRSAVGGRATGVASGALAALLVARVGIYANYFTQEFAPGDIRAAWATAATLGDEAPRRLGYWYVLLNLGYGWEVAREPALANLRALIAAPPPGGSAVEEVVYAYAHQAIARLLVREFAPPDDLHEARRLMRVAVEVFERLGNRDACAAAYATESDISYMLGRHDEALAFLDRAQPAAESVGNWGQLWIVLLNRREIYLQQGRPALMFPVFDEMLAMSRRVGNYRLECWTLSWDSIYSLRYHSPERALQKRQAAMLLAEEFGLAYDRAWSALEIGDVYRVMGDAAAARQWFDTARPQFERQGIEMGVAFYHRGLGDLALAAGEWAAAEAHHGAYLAWGEARDTWSRIYAECGLGRVAVALGRPDEALGRYRRALRLAVDSGRRDAEALPVACLAHLAAAQGRTDVAGRLAAAVVGSPLAWIETRGWVAGLAGEMGEKGDGEMESVVAGLLAIEGETVGEWVVAIQDL